MDTITSVVAEINKRVVFIDEEPDAVEILAYALLTLKQQPGTSITDAIKAGVDRWMRMDELRIGMEIEKDNASDCGQESLN